MISRFGKRILFWVVIMVILPLGLLSFMVYRQGREIVKAQIYTILNVTADSVEAQILNFLDSKKSRITDFTSDGFIQSNLGLLAEQPRDTQTIKALNLHLKNKASLDKGIIEEGLNLISKPFICVFRTKLTTDSATN